MLPAGLRDLCQCMCTHTHEYRHHRHIPTHTNHRYTWTPPHVNPYRPHTYMPTWGKHILTHSYLTQHILRAHICPHICTQLLTYIHSCYIPTCTYSHCHTHKLIWPHTYQIATLYIHRSLLHGQTLHRHYKPCFRHRHTDTCTELYEQELKTVTLQTLPLPSASSSLLSFLQPALSGGGPHYH